MAEQEETPVEEGTFVTSLKRNNRQIKDARAEDIADDAQTSYKRHVEDLENTIKALLNDLK